MPEYLTSDFFENNDHALRSQNIVLRDSLGTLAVQVLSAREDIANMEYDVMLKKLYSIINELDDTYHHSCGNFEE